MEQLTFYIEVDDDPDEFAGRVALAAAELEGVDDAGAVAEEQERSAVDVLNEVTLTITAASGTVGAAALLVTQVKQLLAGMGVKRAAVQTPEGTVSQLVGQPMKEKPAQ